MEDSCASCFSRLATISPSCGHRLYCNQCFQRSRRNRETCGICNQVINQVQDTSLVQLRPTTLQRVIGDYDDLRIDYPFGFLLMGTNEEIADRDMYIAVRQAMNAVNANRLQLDDLKRALRRRITMEQYQLVFVKFIEDTNFHDVLQKLDRRQFEKREYIRTVRRLVVKAIEHTDNKAIMLRAGISVAAEGGLMLLKGGSRITGNAVSSLLVFHVFTAVEVYRCAKGLTSGEEALKNIGEHAAGSLGGVGGFAMGAYAGGAIGTMVPIPVIGTVVGGILGLLVGALCDYGARKAYRKLVPGKEVREEEAQIREQVQLTAKEVVDKAASQFGINVDVVGFPEAQAIFRRMLLENHPDKHPGVTEEEKNRLTDKIRDILACWLIIREYYNDQGKIEQSDSEEGYIKVWALKAFDAITKQWRTVRTFFDNVTLGRNVDPTTERLEQAIIYV